MRVFVIFVIIVLIVVISTAPQLATLRSNRRLSIAASAVAANLVSVIASGSGFYALLRDFQPLVAAMVALVAAGVAYYSAQRVAKTQAEASDRITRLGLETAKLRDQAVDARKRQALAVLCASALQGARGDLALRSHYLREFRDHVPRDATGMTDLRARKEARFLDLLDGRTVCLLNRKASQNIRSSVGRCCHIYGA
jgi:hypothetical protein